MKTLSQLQKEQKEMLKGLEHPRVGDIMALFEELGELAKEAMEIEMYGESRIEELSFEIADVLFSLISMCNSYGIDLSEVYEKKIGVIQNKIPDWRTKYQEKLLRLREKYD